MGEFIIPFAGRNRSGFDAVNLLWHSANIYIMDNHRVAPWCWLRHLSDRVLYDFIHVDQHQDCTRAHSTEGATFLQTNPHAPIAEYLDYYCHEKSASFPYIRWDNFIPAFYAAFSKRIRSSYFATATRFPPVSTYDAAGSDFGDLPFRPHSLQEWDIPETPSQLRSFFDETTKCPCIVDVDLDYFIANDWEDRFRFLTDDYIYRVFLPLREGLSNGSIAVVTIALSPECCGEADAGWDTSIEISKIACKALGIEFRLDDPSVRRV